MQVNEEVHERAVLREKLEVHMAVKNMTQEGVAKLADVSASSLSIWRGKSQNKAKVTEKHFKKIDAKVAAYLERVAAAAPATEPAAAAPDAAAAAADAAAAAADAVAAAADAAAAAAAAPTAAAPTKRARTRDTARTEPPSRAPRLAQAPAGQ